MRGAGHGGREFTVQIVGITVDPADRDASTLVVLDPSLAAEQATAWLSEKDPYSIPALQPFMDRRTARYQSVTALVAQGGGNLSGFLAALRHVPLAMALLFLTVIVSTLALFKPMAVGMWRALSPRECPISERGDRCCESPSVQFSWGSWSGALVVSGAVSLFRGRVSAIFGQEWVEVSLPWPEFALILTSTLAVGLTISRLARAFRGGLERFGGQTWPCVGFSPRRRRVDARARARNGSSGIELATAAG